MRTYDIWQFYSFILVATMSWRKKSQTELHVKLHGKDLLVEYSLIKQMWWKEMMKEQQKYMVQVFASNTHQANTGIPQQTSMLRDVKLEDKKKNYTKWIEAGRLERKQL